MPYMLLEGWRNWTWLNPAYMLHAKLYARLPTLSYLAAFHEQPSDHLIPCCRQRLPYYTEAADSRGTRLCSWEFSVAGWGRVLEGNRCSKCDQWRDTVASCFKQTSSLAVSHCVQELAKLPLIKACCWGFSKALGQGAAFQTAHEGFKQSFLNGILHKNSEF